MRGVDYYELLGVDRSATTTEIKSAYRGLAKVMHPDAGGTAGTFRLLREAYETLGDPARRAAYDRDSRAEEQSERPAPSRATPTGTRRDGRESRGWASDLGADPDFVPTLSPLGDIPWWRGIDPNGRVRYLPKLGPARETVLTALGGWVLLLVVVLPVDLSPLLLALWLVLLAAAAVGVIRLVRRHLVSVRTERAFEAKYGARTVFGQPEEGQHAELLTAQLLAEYLGRLPGVRIFHGVAWPGSVFADVDHAVLCGQRLVLIESKMWLPGHYTADEDNELWRNGHLFRGGGTRLPEGIGVYRDLLPGIEVRGVLVVYPSRAGDITTGQAPDAPAPPMTPEQFVLEIGSWLAEEPASIDRDAFELIRRHVVS